MPRTIALLLLLGIVGVSGEAYLVFCTSSAEFAPWSLASSPLCQLSSPDTTALSGLVADKTALLTSDWSWSTETPVGDSSAGKAVMSNLRASLSGSLPPEFLMASVLGGRYPKVFLVVLRTSLDTFAPVAMWQMSHVHIQRIDQTYYADSMDVPWDLTLKFDQISYTAWRQEEKGNFVMHKNPACYSAITNSRCKI